MQEIENIHVVTFSLYLHHKLDNIWTMENIANLYLRRLHKPPNRQRFNLSTRCDNFSRGTHKSYTQGDLRRRRLSSPHIGCVGEQDDLHDQLGAFGRPKTNWECQR